MKTVVSEIFQALMFITSEPRIMKQNWNDFLKRFCKTSNRQQAEFTANNLYYNREKSDEDEMETFVFSKEKKLQKYLVSYLKK